MPTKRYSYEDLIKRKYPHGRAGHEDDGVLAYAVTLNPVYNIIQIHFEKPTLWFGLELAEAQELRQNLDTKILELQNKIKEKN